jgi:transcriptional regulator with XRE-family HTH domain
MAIRREVTAMSRRMGRRFNTQVRSRLQIEADRRSELLRRSLAGDLRRLRQDAGLTLEAVATAAGLDPTTVSKLESGEFRPSVETYMRVTTALGADLHARPYPTTGPPIHDRHQSRMVEVLLASLHRRWDATAEVAVRRPARGFVDQVLFDRVAPLLVATELESDLRRIEQLLRWGTEKAASLASADGWHAWARDREPQISRLLVVRRTRANRAIADVVRRQLREAYPGDSRDALEALTGTSAWPGAAMVWARLDTGLLVPD